jgi:transient receptor potential cation channel subfamily M member 2
MNTMTALLFQIWKLPVPKLIISVTGGALDFRMDRALTNKFRVGLMRAAQSTGAWIVTGGTRTGVMKHVGKAIKTNSIRSANTNPVVCVGVATWGIVHEREALINPNGSYGEQRAQYTIPPDYKKINKELKRPATYLDPFHTHFLLVDDGTTGKFGVEIEFRAKLEAEIAKRSPSEDDGT